MFAIVVLWCWLMVLGLFLGNFVIYLCRSHEILVAKSFGGSCRVAKSGLDWFSISFAHTI